MEHRSEPPVVLPEKDRLLEVLDPLVLPPLSCAAPLKVEDLRLGHVEDLPTQRPKSEGKVDVLTGMVQSGIETSNGHKRVTTDHQEHTANPVDLSDVPHGHALQVVIPGGKQEGTCRGDAQGIQDQSGEVVSPSAAP